MCLTEGGDTYSLSVPVNRQLTPDTTYFWAVLIGTETENGEAYSDVRSFTTGGTPPPPPFEFADVPAGYWAKDYINAIYNAGITTGCAQDDPNTPENERRYCSEENVSREQMAHLL
jgi:hypothetical protein